MPTTDENHLLCREPGCDQAFRVGTRTNWGRRRRDHEWTAHRDSPHRTWICARDCGPAGRHYDPAALRGHMLRKHGLKGKDVDTLWPHVEARHAELVAALDAQQAILHAADETMTPERTAHLTLENDGTGVRITAQDLFKALEGLLSDNETLHGNLEALEYENEKLRARAKQDAETISALSARLARIQLAVNGEPEAGNE